MTITIRQANSYDLEPMLAWRGHSKAVCEAITREFARISAQTGVIFLAFSGTQLVGTVQMVFDHDDPDLIRNAVYLQGLEVHQDFQHCGIATRLNETLIAQAKFAGCLRVTLMVETENLPALALYTKLGFQGFKESIFVWDGQHLPVLCMALELKGSIQSLSPPKVQ